MSPGNGRQSIGGPTGEKPTVGSHPCFSDDWTRTDPDLVVYLPTEPPFTIEANDHILVGVTPGGDLLAIWNLATKYGPGFYADHRIASARSTDGGVTWTAPRVLAAPEKPGTYCLLGWPVMSKAGRIYVFYNFAPGIGEGYLNGIMRCKYSDDDGYTWADGGVDIPYRRTKFDHPDPQVPCRCIVWQKPVRDAKGRQIVPISRETARYLKPVSGPLETDPGDWRVEFLRYDNIDEGPDPADLRMTFLPDDEDLICVPCQLGGGTGKSFCQEASLALLPDGRLFAPMRTANGQVWYTVSEDDGHTWRPTEVLKFKDDGDPLLNPVAPTPIYELEAGRYILFMQNHDGYGYGGRGPLDQDARRPQFFVVGQFRPGAHQPVWFSQPKMIFDTQFVGVFPLYKKWLSMYASFTHYKGKRILWYSDRKIFVLGRYITDGMLAGMTVPD